MVSRGGQRGNGRLRGGEGEREGEGEGEGGGMHLKLCQRRSETIDMSTA